MQKIKNLWCYTIVIFKDFCRRFAFIIADKRAEGSPYEYTVAIGQVIYTVTGCFTKRGRATAKDKLLRIMEKELQREISQNTGNFDESVVKYE